MTVTADKVIAIALSYVGYHEKASNKNLDSKTANAGSANYTIFGKRMHQQQPSNMDFPAPWCDTYVDEVVLEAADGDVKKAKYILCGDFDDYTVRSAQLYKNAGRYDRKPKRGDQIFFRNSSGICHTGFVTEVTTLTVKTVEGNSGNMVKEHTYLKASPKIDGYGHPRYDVETKPAAKPAEKKTVAQIAQEVIDGKWGTGEERKKRLTEAGYDYATIQSLVNQMVGKTNSKPSAQKKKFPLPQGHWYGTPSQDYRNHSGYYDEADRPAIRDIQKVVGTTQDGMYGKKTEEAVKKWQKSHNLTADGDVGIKTWEKMF